MMDSNSHDETDPDASEGRELEPRDAGMQAQEGTLEDQVVKAIESCFDPEIDQLFAMNLLLETWELGSHLGQIGEWDPGLTGW